MARRLGVEFKIKNVTSHTACLCCVRRCADSRRTPTRSPQARHQAPCYLTPAILQFESRGCVGRDSGVGVARGDGFVESFLFGQPKPNCGFLFACVVHADSPCRVAFGVSASGGMKNSLVAIATPGTTMSAFYTTSATSKTTPKVVRGAERWGGLMGVEWQRAAEPPSNRQTNQRRCCSRVPSPATPSRPTRMTVHDSPMCSARHSYLVRVCCCFRVRPPPLDSRAAPSLRTARQTQR